MKKIKILTVDIGGGHKAPAQAIKKEFDISGTDDIQVEVVDIGEAIHTKFLYALYKYFWIKVALRYPPLLKTFYGTADNAVLVRSIDYLFGLILIPKFRRYLINADPDIVVSTYFTFTHYLEILKREKKIHAVMISLNPEPFESHAIWVSKKLHYSFVFSQQAKSQMILKGVSEKKIKVFHYPIQSKFEKKQESVQIVRSKLGMSRDMLTVLFNFGAEGVGPTKHFVKALLEAGCNVQFVLICGRNKELKKWMEALKNKSSGNAEFVITGFVDNMEDYIYASDLIVGKAGPNSVFEALVVGRPVVITSYMENERSTMRWVTQNKIGWLIRSVTNFVTFIKRLEKSESVLEKYRENIKKLNIKSGSDDIRIFLKDLLSKMPDREPRGKNRRNRS